MDIVTSLYSRRMNLRLTRVHKSMVTTMPTYFSFFASRPAPPQPPDRAGKEVQIPRVQPRVHPTCPADEARVLRSYLLSALS